MRVLHVAQPTEGGVARYVEQIALAQRNRRCDASVACPPGDLGLAVLKSGMRHLSWEAEREPSASALRELRSLRAHIASTDPDIVHLHSAKAGFVGRLAVRGRRPTVFQTPRLVLPRGRGVEAAGRDRMGAPSDAMGRSHRVRQRR